MTGITQMKPGMLPFETFKEMFTTFAVFCLEIFQGLLLKIAHITHFKPDRGNVILMHGLEKTVCTEIFYGLPLKFVHKSHLRLIQGGVFCMYETVNTFLAKLACAGSTQQEMNREH